MSWVDMRVGMRTMALALICAMAGCGGGSSGGNSASAPAQPGDSGAGSNAPPTIQGQPASSVVVGQQFVFQPAANDPDGDTLSFAASNVPSTADFDSTTGRLSWTPTSDQVGTYSNIAISVTDGRNTVSLAAFAITVTDIAVGSATVSWVAPTQNTDGSALTDLAGYEIRYGRSANALDRQIRVDTPGLTTYMVENLSSGTWYFAVLARNSQGVTSSPSALASKTIA